VVDQPRLAAANDLAGEAAAHRERAAWQLGAGVDLADDLDGLARLVVQAEHEGVRVEHPRQLTIDDRAHLVGAAGAREVSAQGTQNLDPRSQPFVGAADEHWFNAR
jgi:hypothetical protein